MMSRIYKYIIPSLILLTNFIMIIFVTDVITQATADITWNNQARSFLELYRTLPIAPNRIWLTQIMLMVFLAVSFFLKTKFRMSATPLCVADLIAVIIITIYMNYCYTGLFLFVILSAVMFVNGTSLKLIFSIFAVACYIFFAQGLNLLTAYIRYMVDMDVNFIQRTINSISTVNQILFFLCIVFIIQEGLIANKIALSRNEILEKTSEKLELLNYELTENVGKSQEIARLKERTRVASEIHDTVGHYLTSIIMGLDACVKLVDINLTEAKKMLKQLSKLSRESMFEIRTSVYELRQDSIERISVEQLINNLVDNVDPYTDISFHLEIQTGDKMISLKEKKLSMRIIQEAMTNCIKHSSAKNVYINTEVAGSRFYLQIKDDGVGCARFEEGIGLKSMRERVKEADGELKIITNINEGFTIFCEFMLET